MPSPFKLFEAWTQLLHVLRGGRHGFGVSSCLITKITWNYFKWLKIASLSHLTWSRKIVMKKNINLRVETYQIYFKCQCGSARLQFGSAHSARLESGDVEGGSHLMTWLLTSRWLVYDVAADMACLLCMMTSPLHQADVIMGRATVHADVTITSC